MKDSGWKKKEINGQKLSMHYGGRNEKIRKLATKRRNSPPTAHFKKAFQVKELI